ncbi:hypothetical protein ACP3XM_25330, partial [Salmonella enterica]|uniref:hypothetical protein n=1 Tax=Salmonella enterica TaxID=28901 RepID=UPI003CF01BD6
NQSCDFPNVLVVVSENSKEAENRLVKIFALNKKIAKTLIKTAIFSPQILNKPSGNLNPFCQNQSVKLGLSP